MEEFIAKHLSLLLSAFNFAAILFLLGYGLSIIYGSLSFMNLAHASFFTVAAFLTTSLFTVDPAGAIALLFVILGAVVVIPFAISSLAIGIETTVFRKLYDLDEPSQLLGTFALVFMLEDVMKFLWGTSSIRAQYPREVLGAFTWFERSFSGMMAFSIIVTMAIVGALLYIFRATTVGKIFIAMSEDPEVVSFTGINAKHVHYWIFVLGTSLAALGGALWVMNFSITIGMTLEFVLLAFAVMIIGGVGSLKGAIVAALLIGVIRTYGILYVPGIEMALVFLLMAIVIVIKPTGIAGANSS